MEKTIRTLESSELYRKIDALSLTASERLEAIGALKAADRLADALHYGFEMCGRVTAWLAPNPNLKHQTATATTALTLRSAPVRD